MSCKLSFVVVGAGIGGLTCALFLAREGHKVTILEGRASLEEIGAGLQLSPNAVKALAALGDDIGPFLENRGVKPRHLVFRRFQTGATIGEADIARLSEMYKSAFYTILRKDLHDILKAQCSRYENITLRLGSAVDTFEARSFSPRLHIKLVSGEVVDADAAIGADGARSRIRDLIAGTPCHSLTIQHAVWRILLPSEKLRANPDLASLIDDNDINIWLGPDHHVVAYCVDAGKHYNVVLTHPYTTASRSIDMLTAMESEFRGWDPRLAKLISLAVSPTLWPLTEYDILEDWSDSSGLVTLLGDAAHTMLPFGAQGATLAIEDARTLSLILSAENLTSADDIPDLFRAYRDLRFDRCKGTQLMARLNRSSFHMHDGPVQEARDEKLSTGSFLPRDAMDRQYGWEAERDVRQWQKQGNR